MNLQKKINKGVFKNGLIFFYLNKKVLIKNYIRNNITRGVKFMGVEF